MNYKVTQNWQQLSDLMGEDYDSSKQYRVHSNYSVFSGKLCYTTESEPLQTEDRSIAQDYSDIYFDAGANPYLKVNAIGGYMKVDVTEVLS